MTVHERPFGRHLEDFVVGDVYRHWPQEWTVPDGVAALEGEGR